MVRADDSCSFGCVPLAAAPSHGLRCRGCVHAASRYCGEIISGSPHVSDESLSKGLRDHGDL
eukprot:7871676-Pyramimonas_sp.AAC.1